MASTSLTGKSWHKSNNLNLLVWLQTVNVGSVSEGFLEHALYLGVYWYYSDNYLRSKGKNNLSIDKVETENRISTYIHFFPACTYSK